MTLLTPAWLSYIQFHDVLILLLMLCCSGEVIRSFVPIDKILKPVLLECVTPVTCYWTLSLIVHDESEMVLVFKVKLYFFRTRFHSKRLFTWFWNTIAYYWNAKYIKSSW